jgi:hypothetical protein
MVTRHLTLDQVNGFILDAGKCHCKAKTNAPTHCKSYVNSLPPKQKNCCLRVKEQRRWGLVARLVTVKLEGAGVSLVMAQITARHPVQCVTKRTVEDSIIDANNKKYSQSLDTPPMHPYFVTDFGYTGNTPATKAVFDGT